MNLFTISKLISLVLRHNPSAIGVNLDENGWAKVPELIDGINKKDSSFCLDMKNLEHIVLNNNKKRFEFNEDKTKIRARQGHSIDVDVELKEVAPTRELYHGTGSGSVVSILKNGISKMSRQHVHLSDDVATARNVGKRHGSPEILVIDAVSMHKDGFKFFKSNNGVWLTDNVPKKYILQNL